MQIQRKDLVNVRKRRGMSQTEAAEKVGLTQSGLSRYEGGSRTPNRAKLEQLLRVYREEGEDDD